MTFALLGACQILWRAIWQGKSESDIHGPIFFFKKLSEWTLEILAPTVTYFKKNTFGAINPRSDSPLLPHVLSLIQIDIFTFQH